SGAGEALAQGVHAALRLRPVLQLLTATPHLGGVDAHGLGAMRLERRIALLVPVEGPHEHGIAEREMLTAAQVMASRVPGVPGLAVGVQQFGHQLLLGGGWETRGDQLPGEDLVVVRVPVVLLLLRQRREQAPRDDVLGADEVRVAGVAVEQYALDEVVTDHLAVVVGLHLHARLVLRGMEADEVGVEPPQRRRGLQRPGTELQSPETYAFGTAGRAERGLS